MLAYDATAVLPTIKIPVLVVGAKQDPITVVGASQKMQTDIPAAELWNANPAKHFGLIEYHAEFAKRVGEFCMPAPALGQLVQPISHPAGKAI